MYGIVDFTSLIFYGIVCTLLAAFSPDGVQLWVRAAIGATIGILAAFSLPFLRTTFGI